MTLIEDLIGQGYQPWFNRIDLEVCAECDCEKCGHKGLRFRGFQRPGQDTRRAVSICPACGDQQEF